MIQTGIWRFPVRLTVARLGAVGQLHRNLDGQGSTGDQYLGAAAVQCTAYRRGNTGLFRVTNQFTAEGQPLAGIRQDARFDQLRGSALSAAERAFPARGASPLLRDASREVLT
jgi:hypothetical protein